MCSAFSWTLSAQTNGSTVVHNCTVGDRCCYLKDAKTHKPTRHYKGIVSGYVGKPRPPSPTPKPLFSTTRPNVLLIMVDDLRPQLGAYGKKYMYTPNIDKLASRSLLLENAYVQQSLCGPSRASILTGRRPDSTRTVTHGQKCVGSRGPSCYWRDVGSANFTSLPQAFREAGWWTASFGKTFDPRTSNLCDSALSWSQAPIACSCDGEGTFRPKGRPSHEAVEEDHDDGLIDPPILHEALSFLRSYNHVTTFRNRTDPQPFFMAVGFHRPHLPFIVPRRMLQHYPVDMDALMPPPNAFAPNGVHMIGWTYSTELRQQYNFNSKIVGWKGWDGTPNSSALNVSWIKELRRYYFAAVSATDELVGILLDELDDLGVSNNTLIGFIGDHGWHLSENGLWAKCTTFDEGVRIPMMIGGSVLGAPLVNASTGIRSPMLAEAVDMMPSLLELSGIGAPKLCTADPHVADTSDQRPPVLCREGISLAPLLKQPRMVLRNASFSQYPVPGCGGVKCSNDRSNSSLQHPSHMGYTMITADHKRITEWVSMSYNASSGAFRPQWGTMDLNLEYMPSSKTGVIDSVPQCPAIPLVEYYDHSVDPGETNNIAASPSSQQQQEIKELLTRLRAGWRHALLQT